MRRRLLPITLILGGLCAVVPLSARAAGLGDLVWGALIKLVQLLGQVVQTIATFFLTLAGGLLDAALNFNTDYLSGSVAKIVGQNTIINVGWTIMRDIANLGFVLALIIIAFATILRFNKYSAQGSKLLPRLIAAAILVNFSIAIVAPILSLSDAMTNIFLGSGGSRITLSSVVASVFGPQQFTVGAAFSDGSISEGATLINELASLAFSIVMMFITTVTFVAMGLMLIARYVWLSFLLAISPIVWLLWIIPGLEKHFGEWWSKFIQWTLFLPVMSFFIYISVQAAQKLTEANFFRGLVATTSSLTWQGLLVAGSQAIVIAALMLGGLIAAQGMGLRGAAAAMGVVKGVGGYVKKLPMRGATAGGRALGRGIGRGLLTFGTDKEGRSFAQRAATAAARIPVVGRAFRGVAQRIGTAKAGLAEAVEERRKRYEKLTSSDVMYRAHTARTPEQQAATLAELARRGDTAKFEARDTQSASRLCPTAREHH